MKVRLTAEIDEALKNEARIYGLQHGCPQIKDVVILALKNLLHPEEVKKDSEIEIN